MIGKWAMIVGPLENKQGNKMKQLEAQIKNKFVHILSSIIKSTNMNKELQILVIS